MTNGMPLVHHSRHLRNEHAAQNPFVTAQVLSTHFAAMVAWYSRSTNVKVSQALHVEIDLLGKIVL